MLDVPTHVVGRCTDEEILAEAAQAFPSSRIAGPGPHHRLISGRGRVAGVETRSAYDLTENRLKAVSVCNRGSMSLR
jgi:hypothetical protein